MEMTDFILMAAVFFCGSFIGLIVGAFMAASRSADDFDGGYRHNNPEPPPVRTTIWSKHINMEDKP
jgi:hypothetical protein